MDGEYLTFLPDEKRNDYWSLCSDVANLLAPMHHLLGESSPIQDSMEIECVFVKHGLYKDGYRHPDRPKYEQEAADWWLLLQVDTDDEHADGIGKMWGDVGMIYFWINKYDLMARQFDKTITIMQCS